MARLVVLMTLWGAAAGLEQSTTTWDLSTMPRDGRGWSPLLNTDKTQDPDPMSDFTLVNVPCTTDHFGYGEPEPGLSLFVS